MIPIYVNDIRCSLENKCYFSALSLALTLPDICGMAEFPNKSVAERYIEWYDKYLGAYMKCGKDDLGGNNPWLSGEIIYNLRNTYLHQGNPGVASDKVKEEVNQLDKFILMLGDGTVSQMGTINIEAGTQKTGKITYRMIMVDVTYLCHSICDYALEYYENNKGKFKFNFNVITQEDFIHPPEEVFQFAPGDFAAKILNQKSEKEGSRKRFILTHQEQPMSLVETRNIDVKKNQSSMNVSKEKREAQVRSFFGRHFKDQIYLNKKEEIVQSVLKSKTKLQVNNNLMKHFTSQEVSTIYQRLQPLIKDLPGK